MDKSKGISRDKMERNTLRQYSVELGLRTHRPSAVTPTFEPVRSSISSISNFSTSPQHGAENNWWALPRSQTANYEQRNKKVNIAYSRIEIYEKANVSVVAGSKQEKLSSRDLKSPKRETPVCDNFWCSSPASDLMNKQDSLNDVTNPTRGNYKQPSAAGMEYFLYASNRYQNSTTSQSNSHYKSTHDAEAPSKGHNRDMKFCTFEEARRSYPSSESDDDDDVSLIHYGIDSENSLQDKLLCEMAKQETTLLTGRHGDDNAAEHSPSTEEHLQVLTDHFSMDREPVECLSLPAYPKVSEGSISLSHTSGASQTQCIAITLQSPVTYGTEEIMSAESSTMNYRELSLNDGHEQATPEAVDNLSDDVTHVEPVAVDDGTKCFHNSEIPTVREIDPIKNESSGSEDMSSQVPPIDLSQLSPQISKHARHKKDFKTRISTDAKIQVNSSRRSRQIAQEIKRKVQGSPKEIAKEIKRRVQRNQHNDKQPQKTTPYEVQSHTRTNTDYLHKDSLIPLSSRSYEKYSQLSPKVQAGEVSIWSCLPDEVWLSILSYLTTKELHSFMMVCHDFNRLAQDTSLWRIISVSKMELSDAELLKIGTLRPTNLSLVQCTGTKLNGDMVTNYGLMKLFSCCGNSLTHLSVASCVLPPLSGEVALHHAALHCSSVKVLDVSWCNLSDNDVLLIASSFKHLEHFSANGNQCLTDKSLTKLCTDLSNQLTALHLQGCFKISQQTLTVVSMCKNLIDLRLGLCHKLSSSHLATSISQLHCLQVLSLKGLKQLKDQCVISIVKHCRSIRRLYLSHCTKLTYKSLTEISCSLPELQALDVSSCKDCVNDESVATLITHCKRLEDLDLSSTSITNLSLIAIGLNCLYLKELRVNFCPISDVGVKQLLNSDADAVESVQLYGVKAVNMAELNEQFSNVKILC